MYCLTATGLVMAGAMWLDVNWPDVMAASYVACVSLHVTGRLKVACRLGVGKTIYR
jgi:hypothetical protein